MKRVGFRTVAQVVGFALGLGILGWVVVEAFGKMTPEDWDRLRGASTLQLTGLVGLGGASVILNGVIWWIAARPVRRMPLVDTMSVNALATLLAYAPFKLSVVFRATYHRVVDGLPVLTFGGWTAAIAATLVAGFGPALVLRLTPLAASPAVWLGVSVVGAVASAAVLAIASRSLSTGRGWRCVRRTTFRLRGRAGLRLVRGRLFTNVHAGAYMLASLPAVAAASVLRFVDGLGIGARFLIAAALLGYDLDTGTALVAGVAFFLIGALAPTGAAGVREGGASGVLALLGVTEAVIPVVLFVTATQVLGELVVGGAALAWLGPRRLRGLRSA